MPVSHSTSAHVSDIPAHSHQNEDRLIAQAQLLAARLLQFPAHCGVGGPIFHFAAEPDPLPHM